ncbi:MAG TPA: biotin--[acetyl-CoA-carboxylase] ligase, partial [Kofleriaceae bacterium]|nr:biotin--[acetyl-CoA-carboxylase] ligase [Kofleriaceae bacterium]
MTFESLHLKARWLGCQRIELAACGSTNDEAARLARAGAKHGTIVIAERQQSGRGRDGHSWESPPGGLYLSAVLRPPMSVIDVPPMTLAIGVGLCDAVKTFGAPAVLKWPNDLLVPQDDGCARKLAGVLVEAQSQGNRLDAVIVGIGVNINGELPEAVAESAITLAEAAGTTIASPGFAGARSTARAVRSVIDRAAFIDRMLSHVERWIDRYVSSGIEAIIPAWQARMATGLTARATVDGAPLTGCVAGLDADGALLLRDDDGNVHRVRSG